LRRGRRPRLLRDERRLRGRRWRRRKDGRRGRRRDGWRGRQDGRGGQCREGFAPQLFTCPYEARAWDPRPGINTCELVEIFERSYSFEVPDGICLFTDKAPPLLTADVVCDPRVLGCGICGGHDSQKGCLFPARLL